MNSRFLLLLGPSGVGKTRIIDELRALDSRFVYVSPYTNRPLREGEQDKVNVSLEEIERLKAAGELLAINKKFGYIYATPRGVVEAALATGSFPVLDWPAERMQVMQEAFPRRLFTVYVSPPSLDVLGRRLGSDGRDADGHRLREASVELERMRSREFSSFCDMEVVSEDGQIEDVSRKIYAAFLDSIG